MSANRRRSGDVAGHDCPDEVTFSQFIELCGCDPIVRVQGKQRDPTRARGALVRFNRAVRVHTNTATGGVVHATRVEWNWRTQSWDLKLDKNGAPMMMIVTWSDLDWVTWTATGDPNGSWIKVV